MHVEFMPLGSNQSWSSTAALPIVPGKSTNFIVAGMLPGTTYLMRHVLDDGTTSAPLTFKTGPLPTNLTFPTFTVQKAPAPGTDLTQDVVFHVGVGGPPGTVDTLATDLMGNIVWYYDPVANGVRPALPRASCRAARSSCWAAICDGQGGASTLREVDLAGDTLRETNIDAVNAELAALGLHSITDFNHDAQRLPNGDTAVLATTPRTIKLKGKPALYGGDMVLVLDQNFQVAWAWDPFNWLTSAASPRWASARATGRTRTPSPGRRQTGTWSCPLRSQDWVIKINYANGTGDGHIIWRLGPGGNFRIKSKDPSPWFSHQHDVSYINDTTLMLFDNGNGRHARTRERIAADRNSSWTRRSGSRRWWSMPTWATMPPSRGVRKCYPTGTSTSIPRLPSRRSRCFLTAKRLMCSR